MGATIFLRTCALLKVSMPCKYGTRLATAGCKASSASSTSSAEQHTEDQRLALASVDTVLGPNSSPRGQWVQQLSKASKMLGRVASYTSLSTGRPICCHCKFRCQGSGALLPAREVAQRTDISSTIASISSSDMMMLYGFSLSSFDNVAPGIGSPNT